MHRFRCASWCCYLPVVISIEAPEQVVLMAEDVPLYLGRFGISQGHNALRILNGVAS